MPFVQSRWPLTAVNASLEILPFETVTVHATTHLLALYILAGGEKKRNEILQMSVLDAELSILDEIDSGLDIDALKDVASAVNGLTKPETATIMVTHYKVTSCHPAISIVKKVCFEHVIQPYLS